MEHEAEYEKLVSKGSYYDELLRMGTWSHASLGIEPAQDSRRKPS